MYEDNTVLVDDTGITINRYAITGRKKRIRFDEIRSVTVYDMGVVERTRLIGAGLRRMRNWYNWDRSRRAKTKAAAINTGGLFHPTVTPDDADAFIAAISDHVNVT